MPSTKKSKRSKKSKTPAATAPAADARAKSSQVEQAFVGAGSIVTYMGQVVRLVLHIFDRHKEHLVLEHLIKRCRRPTQKIRNKATQNLNG